MSLVDELQADPSSLRWRCAHETAYGADVLRIARPGLVLESVGEMVPRGVFHAWMFNNAERLLRAYAGFGQLEEHEADWLGQGVALLGRPLEIDEEMRGLVLMAMASLNTFSAIRHGAREMGDVYAWTGRALGWAAKRLLAERRYPHDPVSLNLELLDQHAKLANFAGRSEAAARSDEQHAQWLGLIAAWKEAIG